MVLATTLKNTYFKQTIRMFLLKNQQIVAMVLINKIKIMNTYHSVEDNLLSNNRTVPSPQPAISNDRPNESEARLVTQLSAPVGMS